MLLVARGRFDEATVEFDHAQALDPLSLITKTISGYAFYYARRYEEAVERFREVVEMDRNYSMAHFRLGLTYAQQSRFDEAIAELQVSAQLSGDRDVVAALGYVHGLKGDTAKAQAAFAEIKEREKAGFVSAYDKALINLGLGDREQATDWLEEAYKERSYWLIYMQVDPAIDPLRTSPRFADLLKNRCRFCRNSGFAASNKQPNSHPAACLVSSFAYFNGFAFIGDRSARSCALFLKM
jgi:tetratricopeptide (TPR) repeat protein